MNTSRTAYEPRITERMPDLLDALNRAYQWFGLSAEDARAATFADAEILFSEPVILGTAT